MAVVVVVSLVISLLQFLLLLSRCEMDMCSCSTTLPTVHSGGNVHAIQQSATYALC